MKQIKAGLIAATPVDTRFGLRFLNTLNVEGFTDQGTEDGVLVGTASINPKEFVQIVKRVAI